MKKPRRSGSNRIMLFTNARDEKNINEWIAHHLLLGFDRIFIFDHLSKIPITVPKLDNKVTVLRSNNTKTGLKLDFMRKAVSIALANNISWMLYLDADEYLCFKKPISVKHFLSYFKDADEVGVNWLMFGSNNHVEQPIGLLIDNFTKSDLLINQHVKSFVRPECVVNIVNPHFYNIYDRSKFYNSVGLRMPCGPFNQMAIPFFKSPVYIAHYYIQSENEYKHRKGRVMDDGSRPSIPSSEVIHSMHNNVDNFQLKQKYSNNVTQFIDKYFRGL